MSSKSLNSINYNQHAIFPGKIVCIGRNYVEHIAELGNEVPEDMVVFLKPNSAISKQLSAVRQEPLHYEGEISLLVENGRFSAVAFGLDLTKRQLQGQLKSKGLPWERAKAFDGSALFSDFVPIDNISNDLSLQLFINDKLVQSGGIDLMMYKPDFILQELSSFMQLNDGDIVMTGTPKGVGQIQVGDVYKGVIHCAGNTLTSGRWQAQ